MHDNIAPLAGLIGTWRGTGVASYPTMATIDYSDEVVFADISKPFLVYTQRTWNPAGALAHVETGYLRAIPGGGIEFVVSIPTGQSEVGLGEFTSDNSGVYLNTDAVVRCTPTAKRVDRIVRSYRAAGDELTYDLAMEAVSIGLTVHLRSTLARV